MYPFVQFDMIVIDKINLFKTVFCLNFVLLSVLVGDMCYFDYNPNTIKTQPKTPNKNEQHGKLHPWQNLENLSGLSYKKMQESVPLLRNLPRSNK